VNKASARSFGIIVHAFMGSIEAFFLRPLKETTVLSFEKFKEQMFRAWHIIFFAVAVVGVVVPTSSFASSEDAITKLAPLKGVERENFLKERAKAEGQVTLYWSILVRDFEALKSAFNAEYPYIALNYVWGNRNTILNRVQTEARANRHAVDLIQLDLSYGFPLIKAGLIAPYPLARVDLFHHGTYDKERYWFTTYLNTIALTYNTRTVNPTSVPKTYEDLLQPKWKGKMALDPEAGFLLSALERAWGKERAIKYLNQLAKQNLAYVRGQPVTTQLVAAGEYDVAIALNAEGRAVDRDKGAPIGFSLLPPKIVKSMGIFLPKRTSHPYSALLLLNWILSERGQTALARIGKGVPMKGVPVKYKEFQVEPDYVVGPEYGENVERYLKEFRHIFGIQS
jgi:iron(III) transport system substrate-binding protein